MVPAITIHHQRVKDDKCLNSIRSQEPLEGSFRRWRQMPKSKRARLREFKAPGRQAPAAGPAALLEGNGWGVSYSAPLRSSRSLSSSNK